MKKLIYLIACAIILSTGAYGQTAAGSIEGNWLSALEFNGMKLRFVLRVSKTAEGFNARLDSIDQGANDLEIESIVQQGQAVRFEAKKYGMNYEGTLSERGDEIAGVFRQGAGSQAMTFKRTAAPVKIGRRQDPQKPYPYDEEEVSYKNVKDDVKLAGTLTLPRTDGQHPAVILITGSGAQDRNETVVGHRPFLVLADYLTRRGVAVLRVDDRGVGGSDAGSPDFTTANFAGDVTAGIEYLKTRKEINPKQIGLIGHSEGGMIAPMVAANSKDVAFIVLLAGMGQTGEDVIYTQTDLIQKADGNASENRARNIAALRKISAILKTEPDNKLAKEKIERLLAAESNAMSEEQRKAFAPFKATLEAQMPMYLSAWFRYFISYDPRPTLEKVRVPVLALNGENDLQVSATENLDLIAAGLKAGGNKDYTVKTFPKLNHLFQTSVTGALDEYGKIEETISPQVLEIIAVWIQKRTAVK